MTLLTLALKNVRHQARSYAAFFLSSAFAVWLFFLYASLLLHPDFGPDKVPAPLRMIMTFMEFVVAIFSAFFILYAHSAFLRTRRKEMGVLTTLGMLPRQIAGLIWRENLIIGLGAIGTGIGLGVIFSRLFFLGIGRALELPDPLPFHFSLPAALLSLGIFGTLFMLISAFSLVMLRRLSVAEIFREAAKPKAPPRFSLWLSLLGIATLTGGYYVGLAMNNRWANGWLVWMIGLIIVGTYLFFAQGGTLLLRALQRRRTLYWRQTNLITVSQLVYKLKDNARVLFMIAILSTGVITLVTMYYAGMRMAESTVLQQFPIHIQLVGQTSGLTPAKAGALLTENRQQVTATAQLEALTGTLRVPTRVGPPGNQMPLGGTLLVSESGLNDWIKKFGLGDPIAVPEGHALVLLDNDWTGWNSQPVHFSMNDGSGRLEPAVYDLDLPVSGPTVRSLINVRMLVAVADDRYADMAARYPQNRLTVTGWMLEHWKESDPAFMQLWRAAGLEVPTDRGLTMRGPLSGPAGPYQEQKQSMSFMVFISAFVSLLFFLASGNMLYFKLFTDLQEDRKQFQALFKLGLDEGQVRHIVSIQTAVLFFAPLAVAALHSVIFIRLFGVLIGTSLWTPLATIAAAYLALFGGYFLVTRRTYVKALLN